MKKRIAKFEFLAFFNICYFLGFPETFVKCAV